MNFPLRRLLVSGVESDVAADARGARSRTSDSPPDAQRTPSHHTNSDGIGAGNGDPAIVRNQRAAAAPALGVDGRGEEGALLGGLHRRLERTRDLDVRRRDLDVMGGVDLARDDDRAVRRQRRLAGSTVAY